MINFEEILEKVREQYCKEFSRAKEGQDRKIEEHVYHLFEAYEMPKTSRKNCQKALKEMISEQTEIIASK